MKKAGSWPLFFMGIGFLIIMTSPQTPDPGLMLFGGILVVIMAALVMVKNRRKKKDSDGD